MQELGASILHTAKNSRIYTFTWFFHIYNSSSLDSTKLGLCGGGCLVTKSCLLATPWTAAHQAPLSMEFSSQEYWSGLAFPFPGDLPDPEMELTPPALQAVSCIASRFFTAGSPCAVLYCSNYYWKKIHKEIDPCSSDPCWARVNCIYF